MELLNQCNVGTFAKISSIIIRCYDKDFDIITLAKKKNTKNFFERLIIYMLSSHISNNDYLLIHQLLNDEEISLNYDFYYSDYFGQSTLKDLLAFSSDRNVIRDLLSKPENIKGCYFNGDWAIQLYRLYAKLGDYEKALELFESSYNYAYDFSEDYTKGFKEGRATADFQYSDSLADFIKNICDSFEKDKVDYIYQKDIINRILNSKNVIYVNIDKVLPRIQKVLSDNDFAEILSSLEERHNSGSLGFIAVEENASFYGRYTIRIATEEEIQNSLAKLKDKGKNPTLVKKLTGVAKLKVMLHELAHSLAHTNLKNNYDDYKKDRNRYEVEAESIAYSVGKFLNINMADDSFIYLYNYSKNKDFEELDKSLKTIVDISSDIIKKIDNRTKDLFNDNQIDNSLDR